MSSDLTEYDKLQLNRQIEQKESYIADLERKKQSFYTEDGIARLQGQIDKHRKDIEKLGLQTGAGTIKPKEGKTKFTVSAAQDRMMGQGLFDLLSPNGVSLYRDSDMGRGDTSVADYGGAGQGIYTSNKGRWVDDLVAVQRAKHAPTLPVVADLLGDSMGEVWKAVEEASAVHRQSNYTFNPKIVSEQKKWLAKREVKTIEHAITNAALGLPQSHNTWVESNASIIKTVVEAASVSSNSQDDTLEMLWELAYWIGCELGLVDDEVPEPIGCGHGENTQDTEEGTDYEDEQDSTEGESDSDTTDEVEDSSEEESSDSEEESDGDGDSTEDESDGDSEDSSGEQDDDTDSREQGEEGKETIETGSKTGNGASGDILQKILDSVEPQQQVDKGDPVKFEPENHLEHWKAVAGDTSPINQSFRTQMVLDDFRGGHETEDSFYGEPQADILHEIRIGNLEVFEDEARTQGEIVVIVDLSLIHI